MELEHEIQRGDTTLTIKVHYDLIQHSGEPGSLGIERGYEIDIWSIVDCEGREVEVTSAEYDCIRNRAERLIK